jgi:hypothetical protein
MVVGTSMPNSDSLGPVVRQVLLERVALVQIRIENRATGAVVILVLGELALNDQKVVPQMPIKTHQHRDWLTLVGGNNAALTHDFLQVKFDRDQWCTRYRARKAVEACRKHVRQ